MLDIKRREFIALVGAGGLLVAAIGVNLLLAGLGLEDVYRSDPDGARAWLSDPQAAPHGGEPLTAVLARVAEWLDELAEQSGQLVAVTHLAVLRAAALHVLAAPPEAFWRVDAPPLGRLALTATGGRWQLRLS